MTKSWHTEEPPMAYKNTLLENSPMENAGLSYRGDWVSWDRRGYLGPAGEGIEHVE